MITPLDKPRFSEFVNEPPRASELAPVGEYFTTDSSGHRPSVGWPWPNFKKLQGNNNPFLSHTHVFKELVPNPQSRSENKRSIELHLEDITSKCSLRDLYSLKEVYQRNMFCSITGVLLEIKAAEIASNYKVSTPLRPSFEQALENDKEEHDENSDEKCAYLLRFQTFTPPKHSTSFYQRAFPRDQKVLQCSVSDSYIVFTVHQNKKNEEDVPEFADQTLSAENMLVVIIDIKSKREIVLRNPSQRKITAVYIDESILMVGSISQIYHLQPKQLFVKLDSAERAETEPSPLFQCVGLHDAGEDLGRDEDEIYAFWHTRNQTKVDVFVKSTCSTLLSIYVFHTNAGMEQLRLAQTRRSLRRVNTHQKKNDLEEGQIRQIKRQQTLNLNEDFLRNRPLTRQQVMHTQQSYKHSETRYGESTDSDLTVEEAENDSLQTSSDDEGYVSGDQHDDDVHLKSDEVKFNANQHADSTKHVMQNSNLSINFQEPGSPEPMARKISAQPQPSLETIEVQRIHTSLNFSQVELRKPLLPKNRPMDESEFFKVHDEGDTVLMPVDSVKIVKVKFHRRNTIVFRSDGHIDFVGSSNVVYSSRNIDFRKMKWDPVNEKTDLKQRQKYSPNIVDVMIDEHDLLLVTSEKKVFLFSLDKMTVSLMNIQVEQAKLFAYGNRLQLFSHYLVFDNYVMVCHQNMISICDLNAKVCRKRSWRHLHQPSSDVIAEDRDTFGNEISRADPFRVCNLNVRAIKLRQQGSIEPRIIVLFNNNIIRMLLRNHEMQWIYQQYATKTVNGVITDIISSKKSDSLVLLRHKDELTSETSHLTVFYFQDSSDDLNKWKVYEGLKDHQRVIQISLQGRFMQDLNQQATRPKIAIYDDKLSQLVVHRLEPYEEVKQMNEQQQKFLLNFDGSKSYGAFVPTLTIENFRMLPTDIVTESGSDDFFYMSRMNKIYRCFVDENALRREKLEVFQDNEDNLENLELSEEHPNMELLAAIASRYQKYIATIEDYRIMEDNQTTYVYASTRSNIYFNQISQFGKLFSGSKLTTPQLARCSWEFHIDEIYNQIAFYAGPFDIWVLPLLSSNRISLRGAHQEPNPIFYQTRGFNSCHMLTSDGALKTWDTSTGKLASFTQLDQNQYDGYRRLNYFRNRTMLCRQNPRTLVYEYLCVEIIAADKIKQYGKVVSRDYMNFYMNCNDNLILTEHRGQKHNVFEVTEFDKKTGQIKNVIHKFNRSVPMNFLSPSFYHYIDIESHRHRIRVLDLDENQICILPQHLYKFMWSKKEQFSTETFINKLIFVDDDFILMELGGNSEILYHVPSGRTVSTFNNLSSLLKYNEKFIPTQFDSSLGNQDETTNILSKSSFHHSRASAAQSFARQSTSWISPKETQKVLLRQKIQQQEFVDPVSGKHCKQDLDEADMDQDDGHSSHNQMLQDFMYQNMKRQRHLHFFDQHATCTVTRNKSKEVSDRSIKQMRLQSVRSFSYAIWKFMEDICSEKTLKIDQLTRVQLAQACFAILPDSSGARIRQMLKHCKSKEEQKKLEEFLDQQYKQQHITSTPTLLHKLTWKFPEQVKPLIQRMGTEWPQLYIPHINNQEGHTPLKLAQECRHRRVMGWLLDLLKGYPFGYCQYEVSSMIFDILKQGFEVQVGQYLDARFIAQPWTQQYQTRPLVVTESGINQTTVNNWPSRTENFEQKFWNQDCPVVPVYLRLLDCPNLHTLSDVQMQQLLLSLTNCEISIFSFKSVQVLLEYTWDSTRCVIISWLFLPFFGYVILYMVFLEILFRTDVNDDTTDLTTYTMVTQAFLLIFAIYFIQLHARQIILQKCQVSTAMVWSSVDLVPLVVNLASICIQVSNNYEGGYLLEVQKPIYACATLFLFLKMFYFLRYFREIGHLVRMIFNVMYQMRFFFVVFACFVFTFACAFYAFAGGENLGDQVLFVFNITIRKAKNDWFSNGYEALLWALYIATSMFFMYIMLNLTVSMVKGFYDQNMRIKTESQFAVMSQLTLDCFPFIRVPKDERALQAPEGTIEFLAEATYSDQSKSRFEFKLRESSFCNQYLMLAETDHEEDKSLSLTDQDQPIKELQKQLTQGFSRVSMHLKQQDEMIVSRGAQGGMAAETGEFKAAVQQAVDERMKEVTERHAREIAELKESQQEIMRLLKESLGKE